jgi:hypothetical protein
MYRKSIAAVVVMLLLSTATVARGDIVVDWNAIMLATISGQSPFAQARFAAITQAAIFEAVNAITRQYEPYLGTIPAPVGASPEAAAAAAAHAVLIYYFPGQTAVLNADLVNSLATIPDGQSKADGQFTGETAAAAMIALRANDGSTPPQFYLPTTSLAGEWQLTPSCSPAGGAFLHWRNVTPFAIQSSSQFRSDPPPALTSPEYTRAYDEVKAVGSADSTLRPQDRADVARFYAAVVPVAVWDQVAEQLAVAAGTSLAQNARAFALIDMAISDALVSVMETKYYYRFWRPETAIHNAGDDGNPGTDPDPTFVPFIQTPCFPSYGSAHASGSYAGRRVVQEIWGAAGFAIDVVAPSLQMTLHYTSLKQITDDIDDARVYGGIHFRTDQEAGARQGWRIGQDVIAHWLQPLGN